MPTFPLLTAQWSNTNTATTDYENLSIVSVYQNDSFQNPNAPSATGTFLFTRAGSVGLYTGVRHNVMYDISVSAVCENTVESPIITVNNKISWKIPDVLTIDQELGEWGYVSTDDTISVWFDSLDLDKCRRIDIALFNATGTVQNGNTNTFYAQTGGFADNLKRVVFKNGDNGCVITQDTQYKIKVTLWAIPVANLPGGPLVQNPTVGVYTVYTKGTNPAYSQWIMIGGDSTSDPCNIKYQFVVQADASATTSTIQNGVEPLFVNFLTPATLGSLNPGVSINLQLDYIRLLGGNNFVYNYDAVNAVFGAQVTPIVQCLI
jgi:hypothetical protein